MRGFRFRHDTRQKLLVAREKKPLVPRVKINVLAIMAYLSLLVIRLCGWCESLEHHRKYQRFVCFHSSAWIASLNVFWTLEILQLQMYKYFPRNSLSAMIYWFFAFSLKMQMPGAFTDIFRRFVNKALENSKWSSPTTRTNRTFHTWGGWGLHEGEGVGTPHNGLNGGRGTLFQASGQRKGRDFTS